MCKYIYIYRCISIYIFHCAYGTCVYVLCRYIVKSPAKPCRTPCSTSKEKETASV